MVQAEEQLMNYFEEFESIKKKFSQKMLFLFLDYDGTLTPIVDTPDLAVISDDVRDLVVELSKQHKVSIVSGRATDDVISKMKIDGIFYAGSHGFEIVKPDGEVIINDEAKEIRHIIDEIHLKLTQRVKHIKGALIEHVKYTVSAHYRLVSDVDFDEFEKIINETINEYPNIRRTAGKKVFELRPTINWNKGKAVEWIMDVLRFDQEKDLAIYIGDDTTDEDAFEVVKDKGIGILVAEEPRPSKAQYLVHNTGDVKKVLKSFIS